jgi:hypothetical protein
MRNQRKYAPFVKVGKRWIRATFTTPEGNTYEYQPWRKEAAIRIYQSWLLAPFLNGINEIRELRPVKD